MKKPEHTAAAPQLATKEFLTFRLGEEEYGIDILRVQEIRGYDAVTRIANTPAFLKGVVNLRGTIAPIIDLRIKFGLGSPTYDAFTVVIILNIADRVVGVVVDAVSDVLTLSDAQIRPAPDLSATLETQYITGLGALKDSMLILIDIERLISSPDMGIVDEELAIAA